MKGALFKIYSGVHLGAVIELNEGTWVVGSDDSADIVLADAGVAARHAAFDVSEAGVKQTPLDGRLLRAEGEGDLPDMLAPGAFFRLGSVLFAWGPLEADEGFWKGVEEDLAKLLRPSAPAPAANEPAPSASSEASEAGPGDARADETPAQAGDLPEGRTEAEETAEGGAEKSETPAAADDRFARLAARWQAKSAEDKRAIAFRLAAVFGLIGFLMLPVTSNRVDLAADAFLSRPTPGATHRLYTALYHNGAAEGVRTFFEKIGINDGLIGPSNTELERFLQTKGFPTLAVRRAPSGAYHWQGTVRNDAERASLLELARRVPWPVVLDIKVLSDLTDAYRAAFNAAGYWPEVTLEEEEGTFSVKIAAYVLSNIDEERLFQEIERTLPVKDVLPASSVRVNETLRRHIRYRSDIEKIVAKILRDERLTDVFVSYLPGEISLRTTMTPERKSRLDKVLAAIREAADVPLKIRLENLPAKSPGEWFDVAAAERRARPSKEPHFKVLAVSGGTLRFVTLGNGEKVFEGGMLPGGFRLAEIHSDKLILLKNKERITYPLRIKR